MKPSIEQKLQNLCERHDEISALLSEPDTQANQNKFRSLSQEYAQISPLVDCYKRYESLLESLAAAKDMANDSDPEMRELAKEEISETEKDIEDLETELQVLLLPKDPNDTRNIFLEVRAGTGGDEAAIFSGDLARMYQRFAEKKGWQTEIINESEGEHGGYAKQEKQHSEQSSLRKLQVGSGDRSERIRTYNYPQGRLTDHRINLTLYKLDDIMGGSLEQVIEPLISEHQAELLTQLGDD
jgi:peptide chain release factor 1